MLFGVVLMFQSCKLTAIEDEDLWRGFPNKPMYTALDCTTGSKQVKAETLAELYGALWVDQPEPANMQELQWGAIVKDRSVKFPRSARSQPKEGFVTVSVLIDEKSKVLGAYVVCSTYVAFNNAALVAAMNSKYKPVYVAGKPTLTHLFRPYKFSSEQ